METISEQDITFTDSAAAKVKELLSDDMYKDEGIVGLRVYVQGGGCSGFNYGFGFEANPEDHDIIYEKDDVKFIVDPMSLMYLVGSTVDYTKNAFQEQFVVDNPNATTTCGCGSSFAV